MSTPQLQKALQGKVVLATTAAGAAFVVACGWIRRRRWKSRIDAHRAQKTSIPAYADILRVGFSAKKLPKEIDHIIIGSGLSGLYLACLLSKIGRRVVVFEQHYVAGGCTHTFKDSGYEFDTGVHYLGSATQFTAMMDFAAGKPGAFLMERQGQDDGSEVYNEVHVGDEYVHRFRPGPKTFVNDLVAKYPEEEEAIRRFFRDVWFAFSGVSLIFIKQFVPKWMWKMLLSVPGPCWWVAARYIRRSLSTALTDNGIKNEMLRATISAEFGDHGMVPEKAPYFLHAAILTHYMPEGGFSPVGGSDAFARALVPCIFDAGGAVFVRAPVARIVEENGRVTGVELSGNKGMVRAKRSVISSAGVQVTYRKLMDDHMISKSGGPPQSLLRSEGNESSHHMYGFVGFEENSKSLDLPTYNIWSFPTSGTENLSNVWNGLFSMNDDAKPDFLSSDKAAADAQLPAFISFPSAKDSSYEERCPGKSTAVIITESQAAYFGNTGSTGNRSEEYSLVKRRYELLLLKALYRHFPRLKGKVAYIDVGTPLTNEHYFGRAASYGLNQDAARFLDHSVRVVVPGTRGLYMTGQDVVCGGVLPQIFAAWLTFSKVVGVSSLDFWSLFVEFAFSLGNRMLFDESYKPIHP
eukprot:TRINITY_DN10139_c0_g1_i1.p1 TRINITY_DN10139_c0_g1~~TRINITY_DN10139_c0_g1_i1.p1  ORF type:complete len:655 (-),score=54.89 TRINITY_DN10139_c0_g1_i1:207-2111(-)